MGNKQTKSEIITSSKENSGPSSQKEAALPFTNLSTDLKSRISQLEARQKAILERIAALEQHRSTTPTPTTNSTFDPATATPTQRRIHEELLSKGITNHTFVRAPPEYYDRPLEFRQKIVNSASIHHLCKSIVMENTRVEPNEPGITKYYLVIVQYSARLHSDKLAKAVYNAHNGVLSKSRINMRLCPEEISDNLTGYSHNGVSPMGLATKLPILISHKITQLEPDFFWLGAGEVDLKVGMSAAEFVKAYGGEDGTDCLVVDCTYAE